MIGPCLDFYGQVLSILVPMVIPWQTFNHHAYFYFNELYHVRCWQFYNTNSYYFWNTFLSFLSCESVNHSFLFLSSVKDSLRREKESKVGFRLDTGLFEAVDNVWLWLLCAGIKIYKTNFQSTLYISSSLRWWSEWNKIVVKVSLLIWHRCAEDASFWFQFWIIISIFLMVL